MQNFVFHDLNWILCTGYNLEAVGQRCFVKKVFLKNFANFTGKHRGNFIKKRDSRTGVFQ